MFFKKKGYLFFAILILLILYTNLAEASQIGIWTEHTLDIEINNMEESMFIENAFERNLDVIGEVAIDIIGKNDDNILKNINFYILISPDYQVRYTKKENVRIIYSDLCSGRYEESNRFFKHTCETKPIELKCKNLNRSNVEYSEFKCSGNFFVNENSTERYSIIIKYEIKEFVLKQGDSYILENTDYWLHMNKSDIQKKKAIILPSKIRLSDFPDDSNFYISESEQTIVYPKKVNERYTITLEKESWYKGFWGYVLAFLFGGIAIGIIMGCISSWLSTKSLKKTEKRIIDRLRLTLYNLKK